jgi:RNA polymerase sigma factor (sigma-70 family)
VGRREAAHQRAPVTIGGAPDEVHVMSANDQLPDEALLKNGDPTGELFATFYRRYARRLLAQLAREAVDPQTAADVVAETFLTVLLCRASFDPQRGCAAAWVAGIARHRLADQRRRSKRLGRLASRLQLELPALVQADLDSYEALRHAEALEGVDHPKIAAAIEALPHRQRHAVIARVVHEEPYHDIARSLRTSELSARQHVSRGLAALRRNLTE